MVVTRLIVINTLFIASNAEPCPSDWIVIGDNSYKTFEGGIDGVPEKSWNAAQSHCNTFGADLVDFHSENEMRLIYDTLKWKDRGFRNYWIGLNNLKQFNTLEWVNTNQNGDVTKPYNYKNWAPGMENNSDQSKRCTFALFTENLPDFPMPWDGEGLWVKNECTKTASFICKAKSTQCVADCRGDNWFKMDVGTGEPSCIIFPKPTTQRQFELGQSYCQGGLGNNYFGDLVTIKNEQENKFIAEKLKEAINSWGDSVTYKGAWIGLNNLNAPQNQPDRFSWISGEYSSGYLNWEYGAPDSQLDQTPAATCASFEPGAEDTSSAVWSARWCNEPKSVICQKPVGQTCPEGWTFQKIKDKGDSHVGNKCYKFFLNGNYHLPWYEAKKYCESFGAQQIRIESQAEADIFAQYQHEWAEAGVTRMWLDLSNIHDEMPLQDPVRDCRLQYSDFNSNPSFTYWADDQPKCNVNSHTCAYLDVLKTSDNWMAESCSTTEAFGCFMDAPAQLRPTEAPTSNLTCIKSDDWHMTTFLNEQNGMCYSFSKYYNGNTTYLTKYEAAEFCESLGSRLVEIFNDEENAFIVKHQLASSWLGLGLPYAGGQPIDWDSGTSVSYKNFADGEPENNPYKFCVELAAGLDNHEMAGLWRAFNCAEKRYPICMQPAVQVSTTKNPNTVPTALPHEECDFGWTFLESSQKCIMSTSDQKGWKAAQSFCEGQGANLVSINSPDEQDDVFRIASLDPSESGNFDQMSLLFFMTAL
ncbi:Oidioi.mRNA.OKI2018_I69.chr1.g260.t1.cds [Oikopleura dioica]|uniref:Oidioi.mRNA.OKI2018_I69.chr1.g260.t1.cds n=1 Tax=Oikopleura dioica TaxID=34765 RepID=A0ABN7SJS8_OIKDI|nr:Oidioi.mRNA.OKI2018_I69.chr1.g260.t1.cds [Oikopleura dioica]